jgi:hypothetical protein
VPAVRIRVAFLLPAIVLAGCAFVPQRNLRLEEAREIHRRVQADPEVARNASEELKMATQLMERAVEAWNTLDDPAVVDHLAYLAKRRAAISEEAAVLARIQSKNSAASIGLAMK